MLKPYRFVLPSIALVFGLTVSAAAQEPRPVVTLSGGLGNVVGLLGVGPEYYLAGSRVSVAGGLGYWPEEHLCNQGTFAGAAALRGFIGGRHRGFLELSYSLLAISCAALDGVEMDRDYGPGISLGYRYIGSDGFTFTGGAGIGDSGESGSELMILLALGYTWRR